MDKRERWILIERGEYTKGIRVIIKRGDPSDDSSPFRYYNPGNASLARVNTVFNRLSAKNNAFIQMFFTGTLGVTMRVDPE